MRLIKSKRAWMAFCRKNGFHRTNIPWPSPKDYPCFVYLTVSNWDYEEEIPNFLYIPDLYEMGSKLHEALYELQVAGEK